MQYPDQAGTLSLVVSGGTGKVANQNVGLAGGYPGNSQLDLVVRGIDVPQLADTSAIPGDLNELGGDIEVLLRRDSGGQWWIYHERVSKGSGSALSAGGVSSREVILDAARTLIASKGLRRHGHLGPVLVVRATGQFDLLSLRKQARCAGLAA
ncbi:hypothetical protein [Saccharopolyspora phatthalungensis]|uniref:Uncharacterized protein n=1 Tax=Saccharopolyspora phatthalungensis TaxID=664693 RepID=A0A840QF26_9PSEU|nr:hypothetical protein [Saccharopolyspora phatthalungensis]MBB5157189.1 hypothetical protein [Saccharopolyspora phatthalungensis]